jgi:hemerythrin-like domain-containing protein
MPVAPSIIREEHRSLTAVTQSLGFLAGDARERGLEPDYELFTLILDYIDGFSNRFHHPKEDDCLFSALRRRCPEADEVLDTLEGEHARGDELIRDLRYFLSRCRVGGTEAVETLAAAVQE